MQKIWYNNIIKKTISHSLDAATSTQWKILCRTITIEKERLFTMYDVTAIGEALIDFIPAQRDCALKEVESFTRVCGGAPANVAAVVAKLQGLSLIHI